MELNMSAVSRIARIKTRGKKYENLKDFIAHVHNKEQEIIKKAEKDAVLHSYIYQ